MCSTSDLDYFSYVPTGPYPEFFMGGGGGHFSQNWTFSSINVIAYIGIYKMKCLKNVILVILRKEIGYAVYALIYYFVSTVQ